MLADRVVAHIREVESRLDLARHYGNPYPRLVNLPKGTLPINKHSQPVALGGVDNSGPRDGRAGVKRTRQILQHAQPSYLLSYTKNGYENPS
ncbi:unnamed protein product [Protopolystoma xenopodis]|uniref:Uncharacterized protein n=1 Tax=Protopolystoma xenopodis TaxID=117903 RepID=A0A3S5FFQ5_9PLAT|nr:unnamed protein product [Protopolystoma xenopodis]